MISQFSVFKKIDQITKETHYIINTGDIHNVLPKFNLTQSDEIKKIIQDASENSLFLFEYPFNLVVNNESIEKCRIASALAVNRIANPVFLHDYAALYHKAHRTIDYRSYTLIFNIFNNVLQDLMNSKVSGKRELNITFHDIAKLMIDSFERVQSDYNELKQILEQSPEMPDSQKMLIDVYMCSFEEYDGTFQADKNYAEELASINYEVIDYLISEFANHKNCGSEVIINGLINNDLNLAQEFGYYAGQNYIQKIALSFFKTVELNILKEIILNPNMKKIFIFSGSLHANNMNELLIKCGYEKIYENISTSIDTLNQLSTRGVNILSSDLKELEPVPAELLAKLSQDELTKELFVIEFKKEKPFETETPQMQAPISWLRRITNFLGL